MGDDTERRKKFAFSKRLCENKNEGHIKFFV